MPLERSVLPPHLSSSFPVPFLLSPASSMAVGLSPPPWSPASSIASGEAVSLSLLLHGLRRAPIPIPTPWSSIPVLTHMSSSLPDNSAHIPPATASPHQFTVGVATPSSPSYPHCPFLLHHLHSAAACHLVSLAYQNPFRHREILLFKRRLVHSIKILKTCAAASLVSHPNISKRHDH